MVFLFITGTIIVCYSVRGQYKFKKEVRMNEDILTIKDTADYLKMSRSTIYKLILTGDLPAAKVGNKWRIRRTKLEEWMNEKENCNIDNEVLVLEL